MNPYLDSEGLEYVLQKIDDRYATKEDIQKLFTILSPPTTEGEYQLYVTVTNDNISYTWK